jgi:ankyrin repeat protein
MEGIEVTRDIKEYLQEDTDNIMLIYKSNKADTDLEYFGLSRKRITKEYNDVHNVFYGCNRVITTLIPREEDYNKNDVYFKLGKIGLMGTSSEYCDIQTLIDNEKHQLFAIKNTSVHYPSFVSQYMLGTNPNASSASHCQGGDDASVSILIKAYPKNERFPEISNSNMLQEISQPNTVFRFGTGQRGGKRKTRKAKKSNKRGRRTRSKRQKGGGKSKKRKRKEDDDTALIDASKNGDTITVAKLLGEGVDVNAMNNFGSTALHRASEEGHTKTVEMLLEKGANVNEKDNGDKTALHWASQNGHTEIVAKLLDAGADVNAKTRLGTTALGGASHYGHTKTVEMLLEKGAKVNEKDNGRRTALHWASQNGHTEIVKMLLEEKYGADVNAKTNDGYTALIWASINRHTEIVAKLLDKGADVNAKRKDGWTALQMASWNGHTEIARLIRNHIKHKNLRDARLVTAKGTKEDGTPLLPGAHRDVATMVAQFMGGKRKTRKAKKE